MNAQENEVNEAPMLETSLMNEAARLLDVLTMVIITGKLSPSSEPMPGDSRHLTIGINSTLFDGLAYFAKFDSGMSKQSVSKLKKMEKEKEILILHYCDWSEGNTTNSTAMN